MHQMSEHCESNGTEGSTKAGLAAEGFASTQAEVFCSVCCFGCLITLVLLKVIFLFWALLRYFLFFLGFLSKSKLLFGLKRVV